MKLSLLFLGILGLFVSCKNVKEPIFENVENLKMGKFDFSSTTLSADIRFTNPNRFGLLLKTIECDVFVDSIYLGKFSNSEEVRIMAQNSFLLPVKAEVKTITLLDYSRKAVFQRPSFVHAKGSARVGRAGVFRTIPVSWSDTVLIKF